MGNIRTIVLKNIQRHRHLTLDVSSGYNCITGGNNRGKSSVVRAVSWVFTNLPAGDWMCRRDVNGKTCTASVKLIFDDGLVVKRVKGSGVNYYAVNEEEYHEFGRTVPQEVQDALGIDYEFLKEFGAIPNIDSQDDQPFLVSGKATERAAALNHITKMGLAEETIRLVNKDKLVAARKETFCLAERKKVSDRLKWYDVLEEIDLDRIAKKMVFCKKLSDRVELLSKLLAEYNKNHAVTVAYEYLHGVYSRLLSLDDEVRVLRGDIALADRLRDVISRYKATETLCKPSKIDFVALGGKMSGLRKLCVKQASLNKLRGLHDLIVSGMVAAKETMAVTKKKLKAYNGMKCPTCGNIIKELVS